VASVFFSYSHADESLRDQLETQLAMLRRQGVISTWHDRRIGAGQELDRTIDDHVETDDIILLLISPDFLASEYCYEREMIRAMERHESGDVLVIPVILRPCDWHEAPFGKLMATPTDGRPVTQWPDRDQAFLEVARAVRAAASRLNKPSASVVVRHERHAAVRPMSEPTQLRSSNLRLAKRFTQRDKDVFRLEAFEYISKFFENSLIELGERNAGIECSFRRIDGNRFTASIYRDGSALARCTIFMGGMLASTGIAYSASETDGSNSYNECLSIDADDQSLFLRGSGMSHIGYGNDKQQLSLEGAAEFYWGILIQPLQRGQ